MQVKTHILGGDNASLAQLARLITYLHTFPAHCTFSYYAYHEISGHITQKWLPYQGERAHVSLLSSQSSYPA